jgi:hypothetical protein
VKAQRVVATLVVLVVLLAGCGGGGRIGPEELNEQLAAIQSAAAEGALLAHDVARGRTTRQFTAVHSSVLAAQAASAASFLSPDRAEPALAHDVAHAARLAKTVESSLHELDGARPGQARLLDRDLERDAAEAERLAS